MHVLGLSILSMFAFALPTLQDNYSKLRIPIATVQEAAAGRISASVVGFTMGNAWISPGEQSMSYGPMLYQLVNNTLQN